MSNSPLYNSNSPNRRQRQIENIEKLCNVFKSGSESLTNAINSLSSTKTYRTVSDQVISILDALDKIEARKVKIQALLDSNAMKVWLLATIDSTTLALYRELHDLSEE